MAKGELLLDTCAALWVGEGAAITAGARRAIDKAEAEAALWLSPISAWEIGMLAAKGRISLSLAPELWVERILRHPGLQLAGMPPQVLVDSSFLPGDPPRDPADRIILATARHQNLRVVTRDGPILDYATQGHVSALAC